MDLSALKHRRPLPPKMTIGDKRVSSMLRDLEKVKNTSAKQISKKEKRCESLIYYIVQALRKAEHDHLLQTTAIWVMVNLFRLMPEVSRQVMHNSGVPGILFEAIRSDRLAGATRQYASELCYYLSGSYQDINAAVDEGPGYGLAPKRPLLAPLLNEVFGGDELSEPSDLSSNVEDKHRRTAFVPYKLDEYNVAKLDELFIGGYEHQVREDLTNPDFMSRFGFGGTLEHGLMPPVEKGENSDDDDDTISDEEDNQSGRYMIGGGGGGGDGVDDDNRSMSSSLSSGSRSMSLSMASIGGRASIGASSTKSAYHSVRSSRLHTQPSLESQDKYPALFSSSLFVDDFRNMSGVMRTIQDNMNRGNTQNNYFSSSASAARPALNASVSPERSSNPYLKRPVKSSDAFAPLNANADEVFSVHSSSSIGSRSKESLQWGGHPHDDSSSVASNASISGNINARSSKGSYRDPSLEVNKLKQEQKMFRQSSSSKANAAESAHRISLLMQPMLPSPGTGGSPVKKHHDDNSTLDSLSQKSVSIGVGVNSSSQTRRRRGPGGTRHGDRPVKQNTILTDVHTNKKVYSAKLESAQDLASLLSTLDPLSLNVAVGMHAKEYNSKSIAALVNNGDVDHDAELNSENNPFGGDDDDLFLSDSDADDDQRKAYREDVERNKEFNISNMSEYDGSDTNKYMLRKKQRIRAEKLVDHEFTKSLFTKKASLAHSQSLISRMESVLLVMDVEKTGFVTWEQFSRTIIALAPPHVLRADVMAFMDAQTNDQQNLVDYREFIISGKVMIVDKKQRSQKGQKNLPIQGWLNRQQQFVGDSSTYTWKNHVKWYQQRKSVAVVWLMRRAARAVKHAVTLNEANKFLCNEGRLSKALAFLLDTGAKLKDTKDFRLDARRNLLARSIHARRTIEARKSAYTFLSGTGQGALELIINVQKNNTAKAIAKEELIKEFLTAKKKQADMGNVYKTKFQQMAAIKFLRERVERAKVHCDKQDDARRTSVSQAEKAKHAQNMMDDNFQWLCHRGEEAREYCNYRDEALLTLIRIANKALKSEEKKDKVREWLFNRGAKAVKHIARQENASARLSGYGQRMLVYTNAREEAFAFLRIRQEKAVRLLARQKEAIEFLGVCPQKFWAKEDQYWASLEELKVYGRRALEHTLKVHKAYLQLQFIAHRASIAQRRSALALSDLMQIGQKARIEKFAKEHQVKWAKGPKSVNVERKILAQRDKEIEAERSVMSQAERWKAELYDAFVYIARSLTPPPVSVATQKKKKSVEQPLVLGRVGFRQLLIRGYLLGIPEKSLDECFKEVDPNAANYVTFDALWVWFLHRAELKNEAIGKRANRSLLGGKKAKKVTTAHGVYTAAMKSTRLGAGSLPPAGEWGADGGDFDNSMSDKSNRHDGLESPPSPSRGGSDAQRALLNSSVRRPLQSTYDQSSRPSTSGGSNYNGSLISGTGGGLSNLFSVKAVPHASVVLPGFYFTLNNILSTKERAVLELLLRYGNEAGDDRTQEKLDKKKYGFMDQDSDEEDAEEESDYESDDSLDQAVAQHSSDDDEAFFADLNNNIGADIGRLMRFLTKTEKRKKAKRKKAEEEAAHAAAAATAVQTERDEVQARFDAIEAALPIDAPCADQLPVTREEADDSTV